MKKSFRDLLCLGLIGVLYLFSIANVTMMPMHIPVSNWQILLFSFFAILFYILVNTRLGRIVFFVAVGLGVGYIAFMLLTQGANSLADILNQLTSLGNTMLKIGTGYHDDTVPNTMLMWSVGLYILVLALPVYYFLVPRLRFYWLVIPGLSAFMTVWGLFRHVDRLAFYIFITMVIVCFIYNKYILYRKKDTERQQTPADTNTILFFLPVAVIIILFASAFTVRNTPLEWPWLDEKINDWYWSLYEKYKVDRYDQFSLANTGFGDPARLGGPIRPDSTPIMVVQAPTRVYLRGAVYDEYTGAGWSRSEEQQEAETSERYMDHMELRYGWKATGAAQGIYDLVGYKEYLEGKIENPTVDNDNDDGTGTDTDTDVDADVDSDNGIDIGNDISAVENQSTSMIDTDESDENNVDIDVIYDENQALAAFEAEPDDYLSFLRLEQIPQLLSKLHPEERLIIRHLNVRTKTLFTPLKTYVPINGLPDYFLRESSEGLFEANSRLAGNSEYDYRYVQPAYGMNALDRFFSSSYRGVYKDFQEANAAFINMLEETGKLELETESQELHNLLEIYEELNAYSDEVYTRYLKLPETVTQRVIDTALSLTQDSETTYDKVQALADYLRKNYTYTMEPDVPPTDRDFVDYFLYDGREGYCSYFASALCILSRAVGIPSRYVEGFVMPDKPDKNGFYHVTNQNAHAWVEVYLEGAGWITVEATPPYEGAMRYFVSLEEDTGEGYISQIPAEIPEQYRNMGNQTPTNFDLPDINTETVTSADVLLWIGAVLLAVFLLNFLVVLVRRQILWWMKPEKSIPKLYRYMVSLLRHAGCDIRLGETPKDYAKRVDERFQFIYMTMAEMVEIFYNVRFGSHIPDRNILKKVFAFAAELKAKTGRTLYFHKRLLLRGLLFRG